MYMTMDTYVYHLYFLWLYCMSHDNGMDKSEVNDAHDNDDHLHSQYEHIKK